MYQVTQRGGLRASAAVAYLHPAMERANLTVMPYMQVQRVLFEGTRAVGVQASRLGEAQELRAEREVILCGGAYNSPQLLMLSGIGPAEHLMLREVEVLLDRPRSGRTCPITRARSWCGRRRSRRACCWRWSRRRWQEYEATQTGPFASNLAEAGGFARVGAGRAGPGRAVPRRPGAHRRRGHERSGGSRRVGLAVPAHPAQPRLGAAGLQRSRPPSRSSTTSSTRPAMTCSG